MFGILAPAGTPKEIVARRKVEITRPLAMAEVKEHHRSESPGSGNVGHGDPGRQRQAGLIRARATGGGSAVQATTPLTRSRRCL